MRDISHHRLELTALRNALVGAWAETPFPAEKIARLNLALRETLIKAGHVPTINSRVKMLTPEQEAERVEKRRVYQANYYAAYRARLAERKRKFLANG